MDKKEVTQEYYSFVKGMGQLLGLVKLYKPEHPVFRQKLLSIFTVIEKLILMEKVITLSAAGEVFLVNGEKIEARDSMTQRMAQSFNGLKLSSMDVVSGFNAEELSVFICLLSQTEHLIGQEAIKKYLDTKGVKHMIPRFAIYKLVKEGEKVVKEQRDAVKADVSPETKESFLQNLKGGDLGKKPKEKNKDYQVLAHDPVLLCEFICSMVDKNSGAEDMVKVLWIVGDNLINNVETVKEAQAGNEVLTELEHRFLYAWETKWGKASWHESAQKTFNEMRTAVELKGVAAPYKKHKKELEALTNKINGLLKDLSPDSRTYIRAKEQIFGSQDI